MAFGFAVRSFFTTDGFACDFYDLIIISLSFSFFSFSCFKIKPTFPNILITLPNSNFFILLFLHSMFFPNFFQSNKFYFEKKKTLLKFGPVSAHNSQTGRKATVCGFGLPSWIGGFQFLLYKSKKIITKRKKKLIILAPFNYKLKSRAEKE